MWLVARGPPWRQRDGSGTELDAFVPFFGGMLLLSAVFDERREAGGQVRRQNEQHKKM